MRLKGWKIGFYWVAWIVCLGLLSCEKEALETPDDNLCLYIQVPSAQTTKAISDPVPLHTGPLRPDHQGDQRPGLGDPRRGGLGSVGGYFCL